MDKTPKGMGKFFNICIYMCGESGKTHNQEEKKDHTKKVESNKIHK